MCRTFFVSPADVFFHPSPLLRGIFAALVRDPLVGVANHGFTAMTRIIITWQTRNAKPRFIDGVVQGGGVVSLLTFFFFSALILLRFVAGFLELV